MAAGDQGDGFLVIHRHAAKSLSNVAGRGDRIRMAVRAFRIDVDEAHLHGAQRVGELTVAGIALVAAQPGVLRTPIDVLLGLPDVLAPAAEAKGFEAHRFQGAVAGEDEQIGPGKAFAVFLLDRPKQAARLVQIRVVRPAVQRRETLRAGAAAAAAIADAVRAGAVPGHANEERAVMTEIRRPPVLRIRHQGVQILLHRGEVEGLEFSRVVEILAHRIGQVGMLVKNFDAEGIGPPFVVRHF